MHFAFSLGTKSPQLQEAQCYSLSWGAGAVKDVRTERGCRRRLRGRGLAPLPSVMVVSLGVPPQPDLCASQTLPWLTPAVGLEYNGICGGMGTRQCQGMCQQWMAASSHPQDIRWLRVHPVRAGDATTARMGTLCDTDVGGCVLHIWEPAYGFLC